MDTIQLNDNMIVYPYKGGLKTSPCNDLVAIESYKPFIKLIFKDGKTLVRASLASIEKKLDSYFVKISRQVIVNMHYASGYRSKNRVYRIYLTNGLEFKVSELRDKDVRNAFRSPDQ